MPFEKGNTEGRKSRINNTPEENCALAAHARSFITPEIRAKAGSKGGKAVMSGERGARIRAMGSAARTVIGNPKQGKANAESGHCKRITKLLDHAVLGRWSSHVHWHVNQGRYKSSCEHCRTGKPPESFKAISTSDSTERSQVAMEFSRAEMHTRNAVRGTLSVDGMTLFASEPSL